MAWEKGKIRQRRTETVWKKAKRRLKKGVGMQKLKSKTLEGEEEPESALFLYPTNENPIRLLSCS